MKLIADSGSTKTDWRIIDDNDNINQVKSDGINPYYVPKNQIFESIKAALRAYPKGSFKTIYFYGAGCSSEKNKTIIDTCFRELYPDARVEINHDLLAAARALCGTEQGIACILGTGANSCRYDGDSIVENVMSLGYLLGDEGSGNHIGRQLLTHYLKDELSENLRQKFDKRFNFKPQDILQNIYQNELPAKFLAGFSKFVFQNIKDPYLYQLVFDSFKTFLTLNVLRYEGHKDLPIHFTGSVAFYYSNILRQAGTDLGLNIRHIVEGPIAGLTLYHQ